MLHAGYGGLLFTTALFLQHTLGRSLLTSGLTHQHRGMAWPATALLALAGAAHGTGFGALSHRASLSVPDGHTASFSGVLATSTQLAITTGIAVSGTIYLTIGGLGALPPMSVVLLVLAAALAAIGTAVSMALTRRGRRSPAPARVPAGSRRGR